MSFYRVATLLISVALLAAVQLIAAPAAAVEHSPQPGSAQVTQKPSHTTTVHTLIQARLDDDGRIEFRLMLARREPLPPAQRYLPEPLTHGREHSCTITAAQTILCWGSNRMGQLDAPSGRFTSISAGRYHTCALDVRGEVTCWGDSDFRQTQAPKGPFTAIEAAGDHTCGLTEQERLKC